MLAKQPQLHPDPTRKHSSKLPCKDSDWEHFSRVPPLVATGIHFRRMESPRQEGNHFVALLLQRRRLSVLNGARVQLAEYLTAL